MIRVPTAIVATAPALEPVSASLDRNTTSALVASISTMIGSNSLLNTKYSNWQNLGYQKVSIAGTGAAPYTVVIGKFGLSPQQLENAGVLKFGSAVCILKLINNGKEVDKVMTPNMFTGKAGVHSLTSFVNNIAAQTMVMVANLRQSQTALAAAGVLSGREDPTQISGLIVSGATVGVAATVDFVKNSARRR
jgi:hypothetical protein